MNNQFTTKKSLLELGNLVYTYGESVDSLESFLYLAVDRAVYNLMGSRSYVQYLVKHFAPFVNGRYEKSLVVEINIKDKSQLEYHDNFVSFEITLSDLDLQGMSSNVKVTLLEVIKVN